MLAEAVQGGRRAYQLPSGVAKRQLMEALGPFKTPEDEEIADALSDYVLQFAYNRSTKELPGKVKEAIVRSCESG